MGRPAHAASVQMTLGVVKIKGEFTLRGKHAGFRVARGLAGGKGRRAGQIWRSALSDVARDEQ